MKQFFNQKRFAQLVLKHWADNQKRYILSMLAYVGLLFTWLLVWLILEGIPKSIGLLDDIQLGTFFFSLFAFGTFYASQYFSDLGSKEKGSDFLLIPASIFEKFLCSLFFTVLIFPLLLVSVFYLVDVMIVTVSNSFLTNSSLGKSAIANVFGADLVMINPHQSIKLFIFFFSIESLFLLGSVYFKKYNFIKTIITCFVTILLFFLFVYFLEELVLPEGDADYYFSKIEKWFPTFLQVLAYAVAPLAWVGTYFVLKSKQV
jgi:hypothetical protein